MLHTQIVLSADSEIIYEFDIPKLTADSAINAVSQQSGTPAIFPYDRVKKIIANPVMGRFTLKDALEKLLLGTELSAYVTAQGVITVITPENNPNKGDQLLNNKTSKKALVAGATLIASTMIAAQEPVTEEKKEEGFEINEITITARRQEENLQKTPIAITAFSGDDLAERGFQNISEVTNITPNVVFDGASPVSGNSAAPSVFIRGVGQLDFTINADPGVGIYVDGVYVARSVGGIIDLLDLERVEVLRGPQGTLFGRNTIGGAIQLISKKPTGNFEGFGEIRTGTDSQVRIQSVVDFPVTDSIAAKVSATLHQRDGYVINGIGQDLGNDDSYSVRGQVLFQPTESFSTYVVLDYTNDDENGAPNVALTSYPNGNFAGARYNNIPGFGCGAPSVPLLPNGDLNTLDPSYATYLNFIDNNPNCFDQSDISTDRNRTNSTTFALSQNEIFGASVTLEYDFENANFKSITAHRTLDSKFQRDSDHTSFSIFDTINQQEQSQFSQELLLSGNTDQTTWVAGLYYFEEDAIEDVNILLPAGGGPVNIRGIFNNDVENSNWAIFGEATFDLSERLHLTTGIRYTEETKDYKANQIFTLSTLPPVQNIEIIDFGMVADLPDGYPTLVQLVDDPGQSLTVDQLDYRINLAYDFSSDIFGYITHSTGFKSGGYNQRYLAPTSDGLAITYDPEFIDLFEIGVKMDLAERKLRLNAAVFLMDYTDIQVSASTETSNGARVTSNAAEATIQGAELEFTFVPNSSLLIEGSLGYLDASYEGNSLQSLDFACGVNCELPRIPELTSNLGISYIYDLSNSSTLKPRLDWSHKSSVEGDANNAPQIQHPSQDVVNASIDYENFDSDWRLTLGISNLLDEDYITSSNNNPRLSYSEAIFARGREWYLSLRMSF